MHRVMLSRTKEQDQVALTIPQSLHVMPASLSISYEHASAISSKTMQLDMPSHEGSVSISYEHASAISSKTVQLNMPSPGA